MTKLFYTILLLAFITFSNVSCTLQRNSFRRRLNLFGEDNREAIPDNSIAPYSAIGKLVFEDSSFCTATLVSPNYILTAGSCIYENRVQKPITQASMTFFPAHNDSFSGNEATVVSILSETKVPETRVGLNYALLELSIDLGNIYGFIPIASYSPSGDGVITPESLVTVIQYADDDRFASSPGIQTDVKMFYNPSLDAEFSNLIIHDGDTAIRGSIGAPLLQLNEENALVLVGIHTGGTTENAGEVEANFNAIDSFTLERSNFGAAWTTVKERYGATYTDDIATNLAPREAPVTVNEDTGNNGTATTSAPSAVAAPTSDVPGKGILILSIVLIAVVWLVVILVMRRMAR